MEEMREKVKATLIEYRMIEPGELVIVGVSGGPDSLALLHLLSTLQEELAFRLHVAHVDHCLRGKEAEEEAAWVQETARRWGLPCTVKKIDVPALAREKGFSFEEAGHLARKNFFLQLRTGLGAQKIALGHQADDQAETLLMHFLVGTGLEGLQGLLPVNPPLIRPLLFLRKAEIESYCQKNGLVPRRDPSNQDNSYLRNRVRNLVLPWLEEKINPNLIATLNRTARIIQGDEAYLQQKARELALEFVRVDKEGSFLSLEGWKQLHPSMQRRLIRLAHQRAGAKSKTGEKQEIRKMQGLGFGHVEEVRRLADKGETGKVLHLPGRIRVEKGYTGLPFYHEARAPEAAGEKGTGPLQEQRLRIPGETILPETGQKICAELVDRQDISRQSTGGAATKPGATLYLPYTGALPQLVVRSRQPGDRIAIVGLNGTKKLKTLFNEKKIPRRIRDRILLICMEDIIIWIPQLKVVSAVVGSQLPPAFCGHESGKKSGYVALTVLEAE